MISNRIQTYAGIQSNLFVHVSFGEANQLTRPLIPSQVFGTAAINNEVYRVNNGSLELTSTPDALRFETGPDFTFGNNEFTIEGWFRFKSIPSLCYLFDPRPGNQAPMLRYENGAFRYGSIASVNVFTFTPQINRWYHIALSRDVTANTLTLFIDGVKRSTRVNPPSFGSTDQMTIGNSQGLNNVFPGYISDFRVSNTTRYFFECGDFIPPGGLLPDGNTLALFNLSTNTEDNATGLAPTPDDLYFSDRIYDTTLNGQTYVGVGKFLNISETVSELKGSSSDLTLTLSGIPNTSLQEVLNLKIKGAKILVTRVLFDPQTNQVLKINGNPMARYRGFVNNISLQDDYEWTGRTGTNTLLLQCNSAIDILSNKYGGRKTNPLSQQKFFPGDISMDRVPVLENSVFNFGAPLR
jgi:hypothetical protein